MINQNKLKSAYELMMKTITQLGPLGVTLCWPQAEVNGLICPREAAELLSDNTWVHFCAAMCCHHNNNPLYTHTLATTLFG